MIHRWYCSVDNIIIRCDDDLRVAAKQVGRSLTASRHNNVMRSAFAFFLYVVSSPTALTVTCSGWYRAELKGQRSAQCPSLVAGGNIVGQAVSERLYEILMV